MCSPAADYRLAVIGYKHLHDVGHQSIVANSKRIAHLEQIVAIRSDVVKHVDLEQTATR